MNAIPIIADKWRKKLVVYINVGSTTFGSGEIHTHMDLAACSYMYKCHIKLFLLLHT